MVNSEEDYTELLSEAARSETSVLHEFRILYYSDETSMHAFFEGEEDRMYIMPSIRPRCNSIVHCYDCGGKPNLRILRTYVYNVTDDASRCVFFADRDHDDFTNSQIKTDDRTYITDFYSIESDLVTEEAADILLADIAGMTRNQPEFSAAKTRLAASRITFFAAMKPIMAWVICCRIDNRAMNLNNVDLAKMLNKAEDGLFKRKFEALAYFRRQTTGSDYVPSCKSFREIYRKLSTADQRLWMRGKYELWFFVTFMTAELKSLAGKKSGHGRKIKTPKSLAHNAAFEMLSGRVTKPASLSTFLDCHFTG